MILTLDIPDALAEQLRAAADAQGMDLNNYAVSKIEQGLASSDTDTQWGSGSEEVDNGLLDALRHGIADQDAGRVLTLEEVDARIYASLAARYSKGAF